MSFSLIVNNTISGDTNGSGWTNIDSNGALQAAIESAIEAAVVKTLKDQNILASSQSISFSPVHAPANPIKTT